MHTIRVVCTNANLTSHGEFGTVVGTELGSMRVVPGNLLDVEWLDYPDEGSDEIDGGNLRVVSETTYQIEALERRLDKPTGECADCDAPAPVGLYQCEPCHKRARESAGV